MPDLHQDADGKCYPLRPPHPASASCVAHCNNAPPGRHETWHAYNMTMRLNVFGPYGNRRFVDRMTTDKKLAERKKK